jgi:hypothetical protein
MSVLRPEATGALTSGVPTVGGTELNYQAIFIYAGDPPSELCARRYDGLRLRDEERLMRKLSKQSRSNQKPNRLRPIAFMLKEGMRPPGWRWAAMAIKYSLARCEIRVAVSDIERPRRFGEKTLRECSGIVRCDRQGWR